MAAFCGFLASAVSWVRGSQKANAGNENVTLTWTEIPAMSKSPAVQIRVTDGYNANIRDKNVLRLAHIRQEQMLKRKDKLTSKYDAFSSDAARSKAQASCPDLGLLVGQRDRSLDSMREYFLPMITGVYDTVAVDVPGDPVARGRGVSLAGTKTYSFSASSSLGPASFVGKLGATGTLTRSVTETRIVFDNKAEQFAAQPFTCSLNSLLTREPEKSNVTVATELLHQITHQDALSENTGLVIIGSKSPIFVRDSANWKKGDSLDPDAEMNVNVLVWEYDADNQQPLVLNRQALYRRLPFWLFSAYKKSEHVVESHIYRKVKRHGSDQRVVESVYEVYTTHPEVWQVTRKNEAECNVSSDQMKQLLQVRGSWYGSLLGRGEKEVLQDMWETPEATMVGSLFPTTLALALASDDELGNWSFQVNDWVETTIVRKDLMGFLVGRLAKISYLGDPTTSTHKAEACVVLYFNKRGGMNTQFNMWL